MNNNPGRPISISKVKSIHNNAQVDEWVF